MHDVATAGAPPIAPLTTGSPEPWIRLGGLVVVALVGGLLFWSMLLTINGAVVAVGQVTVEFNYKTVQHLDGGIVAKLLVRNGDRVQQGDIIVRLDPTAIKAQLAVAVSRIDDLSILQARLEAERDHRRDFAMPYEQASRTVNPQMHKIFATQKVLFEARLKTRLGEQSVLEQRLRQSEAELQGLAAQLAARQREAELNRQELTSIIALFEQGLATQQRLMPLQRDSARLGGDIGHLQSERERVGSALVEIQLRMTQVDKEFSQSVVDELRKAQAALAELQEARVAHEDKLRRTEIEAPRSGRVHALAIHTEGGVIAPTSPILQIIPEGERLVVEAQVTPQDIDKVRGGHAATVRFPSFNARTTPKLDGLVGTVSAAQFVDNQGRSYFTAQIEIPASELAKLEPGHALLPGMPAEVFIETSARSILSYVTKPLTDALYRTFREG